jgi:predicted protein tyrosine phosphatase
MRVREVPGSRVQSPHAILVANTDDRRGILRHFSRIAGTMGRLCRQERNKPLRLLFVCTINEIRSLTAERIFRSVPGCEVRSAGALPNARVRVTAALVRWADVILVMEKWHLTRLRFRFTAAMSDKRAHVLEIPDNFRYMDIDLVRELKAKVQALLPELDLPTLDASPEAC